MPSIESIRADSQRLQDLHRKIHEAFRHRDEGTEYHARWEAACSEFHEHFDALYFPGGSRVLRQVKQGDAEAIEAALLFLEADPRHFRSGYAKEFLWRLVPRMGLSGGKMERLEATAISYLRRQLGREFWYMCRAMARAGTDNFWREAARQRISTDPAVAKRASYLIAYSRGIDAGERVRLQIYREVLRERYRGA